MKANRFTEAQIIAILREAETGQTTIEALCRKHAIGEATLTRRVPRWRSTYGGMDASDAMRLKELERENSRLKKLLAERDLEIEVGALRAKKSTQKNGKRTRAPGASPLRSSEGSLTPSCVCAPPGGTLQHPVP